MLREMLMPGAHRVERSRGARGQETHPAPRHLQRRPRGSPLEREFREKDLGPPVSAEPRAELVWRQCPRGCLSPGCL